jgi:hypothetical protein
MYYYILLMTVFAVNPIPRVDRFSLKSIFGTGFDDPSPEGPIAKERRGDSRL